MGRKCGLDKKTSDVVELTGLCAQTIRNLADSGMVGQVKRNGRDRVYTDEQIELFVLYKNLKNRGLSPTEARSRVIIKRRRDKRKKALIYADKRWEEWEQSGHGFWRNMAALTEMLRRLGSKEKAGG